MHKSRVKGEEEGAKPKKTGEEKKSKEEKVKNPSSDRFSVFGPEESDEAFQRFFSSFFRFRLFLKSLAEKPLAKEGDTRHSPPAPAAALERRAVCVCV